MLYVLILTDPELSYDDYSEDFLIGIFETENQAKQTAEFYLENVKGFCDYSCSYRIIPKKIYGNFISDRVWIVYGYDINEYSDEINIIESRCCMTKQKAESAIPDPAFQRMFKANERHFPRISSDPAGANERIVPPRYALFAKRTCTYGIGRYRRPPCKAAPR